MHATSVSRDGEGVLIVGPSGSGKSDLALRLLTGGFCDPDGRPARFELVADDQTLIQVSDGALIARCPPTITGLLEIRGLGIVEVPAVASARLCLLVNLVAREDEPRLPAAGSSQLVAGIALRRLELWPFAASAPNKILMALAEIRKSRA